MSGKGSTPAGVGPFLVRELLLMPPEERVSYVSRGLLSEILIVLTFILVVLMMFGVRFGG